MNRVRAAQDILLFAQREAREAAALMAVEGDGKKPRAKRESGQAMADRAEWWLNRALHELNQLR